MTGQRNTNITVFCKLCGNGFHPFCGTSKFCSKRCFAEYRAKENLKTFWNRVAISKATGCIEWQARKFKFGYGSFSYRGKDRLAHRISYSLAFGDIPDDLDVLHECDNPSCVNPMHLFLGTHADNMRDMAEKGRGRSVMGEKNFQAKLNPEKIRRIREMRSAGIKIKYLSSVFGVCETSIRNVLDGRTWFHVQDL